MLVKKNGVGQYEQCKPEEIKQIISEALGYDFSKYTKGSFEFRKKSKKDHFTKLDVFTNRKELLNNFTVNKDGENITYGYCDTISHKTVGGVSEQVLTPRRNKELHIKLAKKIIPKDKIDLVAYMILYPDCALSPHTKGDDYTLHNQAGIASKDIKSMKEITKWKNKVLDTEPIEKLEAYLSSKGHTNTQNLTEDEIRVNIATSITDDKSLAKFLAEYNSSDVNVKSDVQKFIDAKLVSFHEFSGRREWRLNYGEEKGNPVADVAKNENEVTALYQEIRGNSRLYDKLKDELLSAGSVTSQIKSTIKEEVPVIKEELKAGAITAAVDVEMDDYLKGLIESGNIKFDKLRKVVAVYVEGQKVPKSEGGDLFESTSEEWQKQLIEYWTNNPDFMDAFIKKA